MEDGDIGATSCLCATALTSARSPASSEGFGSEEVLDITATDCSLKGFSGGFSDGTYGRVVPEYNGTYFIKVARFNLNACGNVEVLDLSATDSSLKGVRGGFATALMATTCLGA